MSKVDIFATDKKYNIIYADPPWRFKSKTFQDGGRKMVSIEETQYETMTIDELKYLPVKDICADDCFCFMWVTDGHLKEGLELLDSWGFKYKTIAFNWIKHYESGEVCVNFAPYTLKSWEICILGTKGKSKNIKVCNKVKGLLNDVRTKHSKKPDETRNRIVQLCGDIPRIELFARQHAEGWDCWGNEV